MHAVEGKIVDNVEIIIWELIGQLGNVGLDWDARRNVSLRKLRLQLVNI